MSANIPANTDGGLITADNCAVVFIDHQPQMTFGVANIDRHLLMNNVVLLAKCAKLYDVPTVLTAVETENFQRLHLAPVARCLPRPGSRRADFDEFVG